MAPEKIMELSSFILSAAAFGWGAFRVLGKDYSRFFRLHVFAAGCYMLEELWVLVNSVFGTGSEDGLVTVRLIGIVGCFCFLLTANAGEDAEAGAKNRMGLWPAYLVPCVLLGIYLAFCLDPANTESVWAKLLGFFSLMPVLAASFYNTKHLLLSGGNEFFRVTRPLNILTLVFYAANFLYPLAALRLSPRAMCGVDVLFSLTVLAMSLLCGKEAQVWKTKY